MCRVLHQNLSKWYNKIALIIIFHLYYAINNVKLLVSSPLEPPSLHLEWSQFFVFVFWNYQSCYSLCCPLVIFYGLRRSPLLSHSVDRYGLLLWTLTCASLSRIRQKYRSKLPLQLCSSFAVVGLCWQLMFHLRWLFTCEIGGAVCGTVQTVESLAHLGQITLRIILFDLIRAYCQMADLSFCSGRSFDITHTAGTLISILGNHTPLYHTRSGTIWKS